MEPDTTAIDTAILSITAAALDATLPLDRMLQFFRFAHLPAHLAAISAPFAELAVRLVTELPPDPERTAALRKLLEAKDCAVRARLAVEA